MTSFAALGIAIAFAVILINAVTTQGIHPNGNVLGWVWAGSTDDSLGAPAVDNATGLGWVSLDAPNAGSNVPCGGSIQNCYGVKIPELTDPSDNVTGYAWSGNVGWIRFDAPPDTQTYKGPTYIPDPSPCKGYPELPCHSVKRFNNQLIGWARVCSIIDDAADGNPGNCGGPPDINSGGWEGWIKFSSGAYDPVGNYDQPVTLAQNLIKNPDGSIYDIDGYAWSPEFGWLGFSGLTLAPPPDPNPVAAFAPQQAPVCGDGSINQLSEQCDPPNSQCVLAGNPGTCDISCQCQTSSPPIASCYGTPDPAYLSSKDKVVWTAVTSDPNASYSWSDPTYDPNGQDPFLSGSTPSIQAIYTTTGLKDAQVVVTSSSGLSATALCTITVKAFRVREIIPFF